ncbi:hypothetical protein RCL1_001792 [Eukaryota sp. TZLM3-RCL]
MTSLTSASLKSNLASHGHENTYQLGPEKVVEVALARAILKDEVEALCNNQTYSPSWAESTTTQLVRILHKKVLPIIPSRYKFVVHAVIGEVKDQTMRIASRWLWDHTTDNFASYTFKNSSLYCAASAHFLYHE